MKKQTIYIIIIITVLAMFLFFWKKKGLMNTLQNLLKKFEGFSATPYWDVSRYSWGYGTAAPNGADSGTISQKDAMTAAMNFSMQQQQTLRNYLKQTLTDNQWAALLSFAYNLGTGNAIKLITTINTGDMKAIQDKWMQYVNVNGVPDDDLIKRRAAEFALFDNQ